MNRYQFGGGFIVVAFCCAMATMDSAGQQPKSVEIPLDQIWGYNLPGTRDIAGIPIAEEQQGVGQTFAFLSREREYNIEEIRRVLASKTPAEKSHPGFVVPFQPDSRILRGIHPALRGKLNPFQRQFPKGELALVFFTHPLSYYTRLKQVERKENDITVYYQFEPHTTPEATVHFALIPLGDLPEGEYRVTYKQIPLEQKYRDAGFEPVHPEAPEIVCRDFSFTVVTPLKEEPPTEGATLLPLDQLWGYRIPGTRDANDLDALKTETGTSHPIIDTWRKAVWSRFEKGESAGPAFLVEGEGKEALVNALTAFDDEPKREFSMNADLSLVFFTHFIGCYVQIDRVERTAHRFVIAYRFVSHRSRNMSFHFALIPLGKLSAGTYQIEMKQLPTINTQGLPAVLERDLTGRVCRDGTFSIQEAEP